MTYDEVREFYLTHLVNAGWRVKEDVDIGGKWVNFVKDNYQIQVYYGAGGKDDEGNFFYGIGCDYVSSDAR